MEAVSSFETVVPIYQPMWHHKQNHTFNTCHYNNPIISQIHLSFKGGWNIDHYQADKNVTIKITEQLS